jgi:NADH dehydrogenase [ubiquinone] 1 alpha subcomplex assembly factor 7
LFIDYGHARSSYGDSLQAVRRHHFAGLFDAPGESDLTAHVDFEHLRHAFGQAGQVTFGPMPMGEFLLKLGAGERLARLSASAPAETARALQEGVRRLIDPAGMGALFKVLAVSSPGLGAPPPPFGGF